MNIYENDYDIEKLYDEKYQLKEIYKLNPKLTLEDKEIIEKAYYFAEVAHKEQRRKSGEPYFIHLVATAKNLSALEMDGIVIASGLLHDSVEDGVTTREKLIEEFGEEIDFLVDGVTKLGKVRFQGTRRHNESLRKLFVATSKDLRVLIIKFADRIHNLQTLQHVRPEKRRRIALESLEIYTQLAFRLGMSEISKKMGDLAFPKAYPEEFQKVKKILDKRKQENLKNLDQISRSVKKKLVAAGLINFKLSYRVKAVLSLYKKLLKKNWQEEEIYDIIALRIILPTTTECYQALGVIHKHYKPMPGRIKDYIAVPKPNGYQSIHTTVFTGHGGVLEIQIRTEDMDVEAKFGAASHLGYKARTTNDKNLNNNDWLTNFFSFSSNENNSELEEKKEDEESEDIKPKWIDDLASHADKPEEDSFRKDLQEDFFSDRIFVFTPNGDVVDLPEKSTPIDFAFYIHTSLGLNISGAIINNVFKSIFTELKNNDIVDIQVKPTAKPTRKWLEHVKTSIAKRRIKNFLEKESKIS